MWPFRKKQPKIKTQEDLLRTLGLFTRTFNFGTPPSVTKKVLNLSDKEALRKKYGADYNLLEVFAAHRGNWMDIDFLHKRISNSGAFGLILEVKDLPLLEKYFDVFNQEDPPMYDVFVSEDDDFFDTGDFSVFLYREVFCDLPNEVVKPLHCPYCGSSALRWNTPAIQHNGMRVCCDVQYATPEDLYQMYKDFFARGEMSVAQFQKTHPTAIQIINRLKYLKDDGTPVTISQVVNKMYGMNTSDAPYDEFSPDE